MIPNLSQAVYSFTIKIPHNTKAMLGWKIYKTVVGPTLTSAIGSLFKNKIQTTEPHSIYIDKISKKGYICYKILPLNGKAELKTICSFQLQLIRVNGTLLKENPKYLL